MKVALLHHVRLPVSGYGGTERVVVWLARGLAERGHAVTLLAPHGSRVPEARLVPLDAAAAERIDFDPRPHLPPGVEVLHAHRPIGPFPDLPALWTLHGLPSRATYPPNLVALSADHARRSCADAWVHNGLDPSEYRFGPVKRGFDLFLGRLHREKGWRWAVHGARASRRRLVVAGGWRPSLRAGLRYAGTVQDERKRELLADAACLWMPALWDEPFGLTLVEALVSGTPVLGTRRGALPEVVTPEVGCLGNTLEELVALRNAIDRVDPAACRARAVERFTHRRMAEDYEQLYRRVVRTGSLSG